MSHDFEDIVSVIDGREMLVNEVSTSDAKLKSFIVNEFNKWLQNDSFEENLPGMLPPDSASQARLGKLIEAVKGIAEL